MQTSPSLRPAELKIFSVARASVEPVPGLQPSTPSLPFSDEAGTAGKAGKPRVRKAAQEAGITRKRVTARARRCPRWCSLSVPSVSPHRCAKSGSWMLGCCPRRTGSGGSSRDSRWVVGLIRAGWAVGELLDVAVERSSLDQLEVEVGRALDHFDEPSGGGNVDPVAFAAANDRPAMASSSGVFRLPRRNVRAARRNLRGVPPSRSGFRSWTLTGRCLAWCGSLWSGSSL